MKKIGFFLGDVHGVGGISRVTWIITNKLNETFDIYVLSNYHNPIVKYDYADNIHISYLFEDQQPNHKRIMKITKGIRTFIKNNRIDILVCAGAIYFPLAVLAVKGLKSKLICWEHSNVSVKDEHKFQSLCRWIGAKNADWVIPLTKTDAVLYRKKYSIKNVQAIYNPIDDRLLTDTNYSIESKKIISVGRLAYQKNFELLVDVANIVLKNNSDWVWHIFGDGENRNTIQEKIDRYELQKQLKLMGRVDDLYDRYGEYSFLVMTSRFEGFPMTLLESTAKGLPAVSFDILTGPNEIIDNGITGYLIGPEKVEEMADKIQLLINNTETRLKMSAKCIEKRSIYSCTAIVNQWKEVFRLLGD